MFLVNKTRKNFYLIVHEMEKRNIGTMENGEDGTFVGWRGERVRERKRVNVCKLEN